MVSSGANPATNADADWDALTPAEQIAELIAELQHREKIVEALTERLEKTSEQPDRLRRSGAERGQLAGTMDGGGMGSDVLRKHSQMFERMETHLADWEEIDGAAIVKRLDLRMEKLIDLLRDSVLGQGEDRAAGAAINRRLPTATPTRPSAIPPIHRSRHPARRPRQPSRKQPSRCPPSKQSSS
ncbi:MAG: hypothetical protein R3B90_18075 [Planctomycetaceae bacterium]